MGKVHLAYSTVRTSTDNELLKVELARYKVKPGRWNVKGCAIITKYNPLTLSTCIWDSIRYQLDSTSQQAMNRLADVKTYLSNEA